MQPRILDIISKFFRKHHTSINHLQAVYFFTFYFPQSILPLFESYFHYWLFYNKILPYKYFFRRCLALSDFSTPDQTSKNWSSIAIILLFRQKIFSSMLFTSSITSCSFLRKRVYSSFRKSLSIFFAFFSANENIPVFKILILKLLTLYLLRFSKIILEINALFKSQT